MKRKLFVKYAFNSFIGCYTEKPIDVEAELKEKRKKLSIPLLDATSQGNKAMSAHRGSLSIPLLDATTRENKTYNPCYSRLSIPLLDATEGNKDKVC